MNVVLLKPAEVAQALGISENGVYRMIAGGEIRVVDVSQPGAKTSKTRIRSDDLAEFIESRTRSPASTRDEVGPSRQASRPRRRTTAPATNSTSSGRFQSTGRPHRKG